eukprot:CAMPEP_0198280954 /NCGR_PEP_ID=MMETSP1449-20131203/983_1 /TAXON_ID=420275 /ORGANISM="Attheya septentrionalis, Strain CCMP2084" /LENGTH=113 /DNA_ID=CAMNT_0043976547 /DNA_START=60 /DNA_END=401 /DNA_ORIENTATION=+
MKLSTVFILLFVAASLQDAAADSTGKKSSTRLIRGQKKRERELEIEDDACDEGKGKGKGKAGEKRNLSSAKHSKMGKSKGKSCASETGTEIDTEPQGDQPIQAADKIRLSNDK